MSKIIFKSVLSIFLFTMITVTLTGFLNAGEEREKKASLLTPEFLGEINAAEGVQAILARRAVYGEVIIAAKDSGYGPARIWKMTLDPITGNVVSILSKQILSQTMNVSDLLYETASGTIFTGAGWLGFNSPYYSVNGGETWLMAGGGSIRNSYSTYSFIEFKGNLYAGSGYYPNHGKLHRWLGNGNWAEVFDYPPPRSILNVMAVYKEAFFFSAVIYWWNNQDWQISVPVYQTPDGVVCHPAPGIPPDRQITHFFIINGELLSWTFNQFDSSQRHVYRWDGRNWVLLGVNSIQWSKVYRIATTDGRVIYNVGRAPGDSADGVCCSLDGGLTWEQIAIIENEPISALHLAKNVLYMGTERPGNRAGLYRINVMTEATAAIKPNHLNLKSKGKWATCYIELGSGASAEDIDTGSVAITHVNGAAITPVFREGPLCLGDEDGDGIPDLMVKFSRSRICQWLRGLNAGKGGVFELTVSGVCAGGAPFAGNAVVIVVNTGK